MPQSNEPIKQRPKVEDESTGNPSERHGPHREGDEALAGKGSTKGGLNKQAGEGGAKENAGRPKGDQDLEQGQTKGISEKERESY